MTSRPARLALTLGAGALLSGLLLVPSSGTAQTAAAADDAIDILVLGDSYSAGNGATDEAGAPQTYGPDGCRRSRVNWGEKYAAALRSSGQAVRLVNHACSGGVTADVTSPRQMDTQRKVMATPAGVSTAADADVFLTRTDPCNTRAFPGEEFWTYRTTSVTPLVLTYDCTRNLRAQADFVNSDVDLVLFTMGGNDAGFSAIVQNCFVPVTRSSSGCKSKVDAARARLPQIRERLLADVAAIRAHGLRKDAKMVQLGYPWLQVDNDFTLADPPGYAAGDQVRALVSEGNAAIAAVVPIVNERHPEQMSFLAGVPEKFSGHEPDATTPSGNRDRWINQAGDGDAVEVWYHPNRLGHAAYADLLMARGTFGAPNGPPVVTTQSEPRARMRVRLDERRVDVGERLLVKVRVRLSDGSRPRGKVIVRAVASRKKLATTRMRGNDRGRIRLTLRLRSPGKTRLRVVYRDRVAPVVRTTRRVQVSR